jgi:type IV secretion system protein VirB6
MPSCPAFDPLGPYVSGMVAFVDCQARGLGEEGYRAMASGSLGFALSGLLTIYVALIGYRLLLGETFTVRSGVLIAVRVGIVVALATQWSAFRTLAYDVAMDGPGEIAARILGPGGLGGEDVGGLAARIQGGYEFVTQAIRPDAVSIPAQTNVGAPPQDQQGQQAEPPNQQMIPALSQEARATLASSNAVLLVTTIAGMLSVRIVAGLLLALGPLFIAALLFDATRGLFEGWVRALAGAALGSVGVNAVLALELAVLEPQWSALSAGIDAFRPADLLPGQILASTVLFAAVLVAALLGTARAAAGFRFPALWRAEPMPAAAPPVPLAAPRPLLAANAALEPRDERPRARAVADAVTLNDRRTAGRAFEDAGVPAGIARTAAPAETGGGSRPEAWAQPLGQSYRRARRHSAGASRRDAQG